MPGSPEISACGARSELPSASAAVVAMKAQRRIDIIRDAERRRWLNLGFSKYFAMTQATQVIAQRILIARRQGATLREIGSYLGVHPHRVRQFQLKAENSKFFPIHKYFHQTLGADAP